MHIVSTLRLVMTLTCWTRWTSRRPTQLTRGRIDVQTTRSLRRFRGELKALAMQQRVFSSTASRQTQSDLMDIELLTTMKLARKELQPAMISP